MKQEFFIDIMRQAADVTRRIQQDFATPETWEKQDRSPVTIGDLAVQTLVAARLEQFCPDIPLVAEESAEAFLSEAGRRFLDKVVEYLQPHLPEITPERAVRWITRGKNDDSLAQCDRFWTLDPIDGTKGFLRKEQYATALALVENQVVTLGFLGVPNLTWLGNGFHREAGGVPENDNVPCGSLLMARRGEGAWIANLFHDDAFVKIHVSAHATFEKAKLLRSVEAGHTNADQIGEIAEQLGIHHPPICMDSQAKYALLATGIGDIYLRLLSPQKMDYKEKIWDHAAGLILLEEAGGRVTDLNGQPLDFSHGSSLYANTGICATNGLLHDQVLSALHR